MRKLLFILSLVGLAACNSAESDQAEQLAAARAAEQARVNYLNSPAGRAETLRKLNQHTKNLSRDYQQMRIP